MTMKALELERFTVLNHDGVWTGFTDTKEAIAYARSEANKTNCAVNVWDERQPGGPVVLFTVYPTR